MKRGFTLVELLAVLVILAIISTITIPIIGDAINKGENTVELNQATTILNAAYDWSLKNSAHLPDTGKSISITLGQLKQEGLVDVDIKSPSTKELYPNDMLITISNTKDESNSDYSKRAGKYLYSLNISTGSNISYNEYSPTIILNGDATMYVDLNGTFTEPGYSAFTYDKDDITGSVTTQILIGGTAVSSIDSTTLGVYEIHYTVSDENNSIDIIRNVIVKDISAPNLVIKGNDTITTSITSYNLNEGASCTDNSGTCDIKITGDLKLGKKGKNVITYTAIDPSGNKTVKKRIITIK